MANVPKRFVDETLWPEYEKLDEILNGYLEEITDRVISGAVFNDSSEAEVRSDTTKQISEK